MASIRHWPSPGEVRVCLPCVCPNRNIWQVAQDQANWLKPWTKKALPLRSTFLVAHAQIIPLAIRMAKGVMLECVRPCNQAAVFWTAAPGCVLDWRQSIRLTGGGAF